MALSITDLKKGTVFQWQGVPYRVIECGQKVMGRGGSIVNVKIKSLSDGKVLEKTFKGSDAVEPADIINLTAQYLYADSDNYYFMNDESFETHMVNKNLVGGSGAYLKEGGRVQAQVFNGQIIAIELPKNVFLKVIRTQDAVKGDTTTAITKEAELETGVVVKVPAFIKTNDIISVDTTTGIYRERKKS